MGTASMDGIERYIPSWDLHGSIDDGAQGNDHNHEEEGAV